MTVLADTPHKPARRSLKRRIARILGFLFLIYLVLVYLVLPVGFAAVIAFRPRGVCCDPTDKLDKNYEEATFSTTGDVELSGWYIPSDNGAAIIVLHGSWGNRTKVVDHANMLAGHGYGVLMFDLSQDNWVLGWAVDEEVAAAVTYLLDRSDVDPDRIGGLGLSLGAEALLQSAARNDQIQAVVADGAGSRSYKEATLVAGAGKWLEAPQTWLMSLSVKVFSGVDAPPSLKALVPLIGPRSVFFISTGEAEEAELNRIYYEAAQEPKLLWNLPDADHTGGLKAHPEEYEQRVIAFFDQVLLQRN